MKTKYKTLNGKPVKILDEVKDFIKVEKSNGKHEWVERQELSDMKINHFIEVALVNFFYGNQERLALCVMIILIFGSLTMMYLFYELIKILL